MINSNNNYTIAITKEELSKLPRVDYFGQIKIIETEAEMHKAIEVLRTQKLIGFDTESRPRFKKGLVTHVSLIQLATENICFLFRICKLKNIEPLKEIFESADILKIGLSIHDDFHILSNDYKLSPKGFIDLQKIVPKHNFSNTSLQKIYAILFDERISKSQQLSNWEAEFLTAAQQKYAAIDAWACIQIYKEINRPEFKPENLKYKQYIPDDEEV